MKYFMHARVLDVLSHSHSSVPTTDLCSKQTQILMEYS